MIGATWNAVIDLNAVRAGPVQSCTGAALAHGMMISYGTRSVKFPNVLQIVPCDGGIPPYRQQEPPPPVIRPQDESRSRRAVGEP